MGIKGQKNQYSGWESRVPQIIAERCPGWEYIGGFTHSDGFVIVRHTECGFTTRKSYTTMKHGRATRCWLCEQKAKAAEKKKKENAERVQMSRVMKYYQTPLRECAICGTLFYPGKRKTYCSDACSRKSVNRYYTERKRKKGLAARTNESKYISVESLFRRDGGVCQICGEPCDITAEPNADLYPSVDHIIPLAHGGLDRLDNVRLAHRICNSRRGDRYTPSRGNS